MKLPQLRSGVLLLAGLFGLPSLAVPALAASRGDVLLDFTDSRRDREAGTGRETVIHCYEYTWGGWDKHVFDVRRKGAVVKAGTAAGQLGEQRTEVNFGKAPAAELEYVVGPNNRCKNLYLRLTDGDGTEGEWRIPLEGKTPNILTTVSFDLTKPDNPTKPGKIPGMDLKHIAGWEIHGDWSQDSTEVILVKLFAVK